ncbi:hypothetical protein U732_2033 [Clostridium argentinense CDC 2741]|uniref:Uncharacterized protein n=1 Tax=Clostridium argentinense CDC 2741 TaxID=1418104 RepID=A0A0C1UG82_9CLOT|nr:hypothetical protein [Clostridium argentinense]KIE46410.1 hypothetical protein U732_2033 [Clostridium argentinense CDC 2741]
MSDINKEILGEEELLEEELRGENHESSHKHECSSNCGVTKIYTKTVNIWIKGCGK